MRAWILGILLVVVGLVLVVGLWLLGYHLSGKWAFNRWKSERITMGDRLDWKDLVPPPVDPNQNFAETPLIRGSIVEKGRVDPRFKALSIPENVTNVLGNWQEGRRDDLKAICQAYGTTDLQAVLKPLEGALKEVELASLRPGSRLPVAYEEYEIPALLGFRGMVRTLRVRALSNLRRGRSDLAMTDLQTCFRIADHLKAEPNLLSALLRVAILKISMQVVWEGVEDHVWSASQLALIQADLSKVDLLATSKLAWQAERQCFISSFTVTAENQPPLKFMAQKRAKLGPLGRGWFYRNLLVWCQFVSSMVDTQDPVAHRIFPSRLIDPVIWLKEMRFRKDLIMAQIALPALTEQVVEFSRLQALIDQSIVVCGLERHRLERGRYPDHLDGLVPTYIQALSHDLVTGGPLHYRRVGDRFTLYQVGWDGKDEGGAVAWKGEGDKRVIDSVKGDWPWPHANP